MRRTLLLPAALAALLLPTFAAGLVDPAGPARRPWEALQCGSPEVEAARAVGADPFTHAYADASLPALALTVHLVCPGGEPAMLALPSDCPATAWAHNGLRWTRPYAGLVDPWNPSGIPPAAVVPALALAAEAWDAEVSTDLFTAFAAGGSRGNVGAFDGVNQHGWRSMGSTVAAIYVWSSAGVALEADVAYGTNVAWSTSGSPAAMDVQNVGAHLMGRVFGMDRVFGSANACLTMYAALPPGETQKRTLGDGDALGIKALYA